MNFSHVTYTYSVEAAGVGAESADVMGGIFQIYSVAVNEIVRQASVQTLGKLPRHGAIMHLFLAIDATDLDLSHIEDPAHLVVQVR